MARPDELAIPAERFEAATRLIESWHRPLLITHDRPDGDGLACLVAMRALLSELGKHPVAMIYEPCPPRYANMEGVADLHVMTGPDDPVLSEADGELVMDTCSYTQLHRIEDWLRRSRLPRIVLDHHLTRDLPADVYLIDSTAAACSLIVGRWARTAEWRLPPIARTAIFTGVATDTGWFQYSNTTAEALRIAADLVEAGMAVDEAYRRLYMNDPVSKLRLHGAAMAGVELIRDGKIAVMKVPGGMFAATQSTRADTEELVNAPLCVDGVELVVLLVEADRDLVKCSFRSKGAIDVAQLAASFGGGGHSRAAGARIPGTLESVQATILEAVPPL